MEATRKVGVWVRVSTDMQVKDESPEHHERRGRSYAEARGWEVVTVYRLDALSGKSVMDYPETKRMLGDLAAGRISGLIFSKLARLARNTRELLELADIFVAKRADLISLGESIDTSTPAGRLFFTIVGAMAQWEREEISARVAASVPIRAKMGKPTGGAAPFGYQWENQRLVVDPKEAPVRSLMYDLFLEHRRLRTVARLLNDRGHRTRSGALFAYSTVRRLLEDPIAKGTRRANYTKSRGDGLAWDYKPEDEWVLSEVDPIVPEEIWERANSILREREKTGEMPVKKGVNLFAGFVGCGCGQRMYVPSAKPPKYVCKCGNRIPADDLEAVYKAEMSQLFISSEGINRFLAEAERGLREKEELLESLESEHGQVRREKEKLYQLYLADGLTVLAFKEKNAPLEERLGQLNESIPKLTGELDYLRVRVRSGDEVRSTASHFWGRWDLLALEEKRQVVEQITERIVVGNGDIEIIYCHLGDSPPASQTDAGGHHNLKGSSRR